MSRRSVRRLVDTNANRAFEGMRVCEDIARFHLGAAAVFRQLRALRHALAKAMARLPDGPRALVESRESRRDPGRRAPSSRVRSLEQVALINAQRAKEALRALEECSRLIPSADPGAFQRLRFRLYDAERSLLLATLRHR